MWVITLNLWGLWASKEGTSLRPCSAWTEKQLPYCCLLLLLATINMTPILQTKKLRLTRVTCLPSHTAGEYWLGQDLGPGGLYKESVMAFFDKIERNAESEEQRGSCGCLFVLTQRGVPKNAFHRLSTRRVPHHFISWEISSCFLG